MNPWLEGWPPLAHTARCGSWKGQPEDCDDTHCDEAAQAGLEHVRPEPGSTAAALLKIPTREAS